MLNDAHPVATVDPAYDVIVVGASAGGLVASTALLRGLPEGRTPAIVIMLHLPPEAATDAFYERLGFKAAWLRPDSQLVPGSLFVCPPRSFVEVLPDGTCRISPAAEGALERPIDRFLDSAARSFGPRAIGVILTGMGSDGAAGARTLRTAGGRMIVQSESSCDQPEMPAAAIAAGAAELVVPLRDIGQVIGEILAGAPRPKSRSEIQAVQRAFGDEGEMARLARETDWSRTRLGPVLAWPDELRLMVRSSLDSTEATAVWWGPELLQIYNDAWRTLLGAAKHPAAFGAPARETGPEIWRDLGPMVQRVMTRGETASGENQLLMLERHGALEEVYVTFAHSPIRNVSGEVVGVRNTGRDTTQHVVADRRTDALRDLGAALAGAGDTREACELAAAALGKHSLDVPFALFYLKTPGRREATLAGAAGVAPGSAMAAHAVPLTSVDQGGWPLGSLFTTADAQPVIVADLAARFPGLVPFAMQPGLPPGWQAPQRAVALPLRATSGREPTGVLIVALSPHRPYDERHAGFVEMLAQQASAGLGAARARQLERERLERLAELDRSKTEFFSNVSHEFRTPLTLLLAPLEELARRREQLPARAADELDVATRNAHRLLRLVNSLLDFSQIEARRERAAVELVDIGKLTGEIASAFRDAIETAGLALRVEIAEDLPPVPVNREMWEKVLSNLISNAFKFTFTGEVVVRVKALRLHAELEVSDSGVGIPPAELPNVFKRFHRVRGTRARSVEGAGIGLAIVHDLVQRMGGQVAVRSVEGTGTAFTIWMPFKPIAQPVGAPQAAEPGPGVAAALAREAAAWNGIGRTVNEASVIGEGYDLPDHDNPRLTRGARVLIAEDNAEMRDYLVRMLEGYWHVTTVADGTAALDAARSERPELILADVMMPRRDGFSLLRAIRDDKTLRRTAVVFLTARAGEEATIEGLLAGADDYLAKPFSGRELVARLSAAIERSRADAALRESEGRFRALVKASSDVVYRMSPDWTEMRRLEGRGFLSDSIQPSTNWMTGYIPPEEQAMVQAAIRRAVVTRSTFELEHRVLRRDGSLGWTLSRALPVFDDAGHITEWLGTASDVTERKLAEIALRESTGRLRRSQIWVSAQKEAFEAAMNGGSLETSLGVLIRTLIAQAEDERRCAFYIADGKHLRHIVGMSEDYARRVEGFQISPESLADGLAVATGMPVVTPDVLEEPRWRPWRWLALEFGYRGCWSFPVETSDGRLVGSLAMYFAEPREPSAVDLELATAFAQTAAVIISRHGKPPRS